VRRLEFPGEGTARRPLMYINNPFAELSASIPPAVMQAYVVIMIILVVRAR